MERKMLNVNSIHNKGYCFVFGEVKECMTRDAQGHFGDGCSLCSVIRLLKLFISSDSECPRKVG